MIERPTPGEVYRQAIWEAVGELRAQCRADCLGRQFKTERERIHRATSMQVHRLMKHLQIRRPLPKRLRELVQKHVRLLQQNTEIVRVETDHGTKRVLKRMDYVV